MSLSRTSAGSCAAGGDGGGRGGGGRGGAGGGGGGVEFEPGGAQGFYRKDAALAAAGRHGAAAQPFGAALEICPGDAAFLIRTRRGSASGRSTRWTLR